MSRNPDRHTVDVGDLHPGREALHDDRPSALELAADAAADRARTPEQRAADALLAADFMPPPAAPHPDHQDPF